MPIMDDGILEPALINKQLFLSTWLRDLSENYNAAVFDFCLSVTEHDLHQSVQSVINKFNEFNI